MRSAPDSGVFLYDAIGLSVWWCCGLASLVALVLATSGMSRPRQAQPDPAVIEPAVIEPAVIEPAVIEPAVIEPAAAGADPVGPAPVGPVDIEQSARTVSSESR